MVTIPSHEWALPRALPLPSPSVRNFRATSVKASAGQGSNQMAVVQLTSEGYIPRSQKGNQRWSKHGGSIE